MNKLASALLNEAGLGNLFGLTIEVPADERYHSETGLSLSTVLTDLLCVGYDVLENLLLNVCSTSAHRYLPKTLLEDIDLQKLMAGLQIAVFNCSCD